MKKTIQKVIRAMVLSLCLASHLPVFATVARLEVDWSIGVKFWTKRPIKMVMERFVAQGAELAFGPFVEYKLWDSIGIQTGIIGSWNNLTTAGFNLQMDLVHGWSGRPQPREDSASNSSLIDVDCVRFYAIAIPVSIRWYLDSDRRLALHGGWRWMIPLSKAKQACYGYVSADNDKDRQDLLKMVFKVIDFVKGKSDQPLDNDLEIKPHCTMDFGFDYHAQSGLIIGINGLGGTIGYDFAKRWVQ